MRDLRLRLLLLPLLIDEGTRLKRPTSYFRYFAVRDERRPRRGRGEEKTTDDVDYEEGEDDVARRESSLSTATTAIAIASTTSSRHCHRTSTARLIGRRDREAADAKFLWVFFSSS